VVVVVPVKLVTKVLLAVAQTLLKVATVLLLKSLAPL
jgi:hypothetical protein